MFSVSLGQSDAPESRIALEEVIGQCRQGLKGKPCAGIFYTSDMDADFSQCLEIVAQHFPDIELVGCTTDGEMSSAGGFLEQAYSLLLFVADTVEFASGVGHGLSSDPAGAVSKAITEAREQLDATPALCIVLPDGFGAFGRGVDLLASELLPGVPVVGGSAGDNYRIQQTFQFRNREVNSDTATVLLMGGPVKCGFSVKNGWTPTGREHKVTAAQGSMLLEVDGIPAIRFYEKYIGREVSDISDINQFCVAYYLDDDEFLIRAPAAVDLGSGGIVMAGPMPVGASLRMTGFERDKVVDAAGDCAAEAVARYPGEAPRCLLAFSCTSRRQILGSRTAEELDQLKANVPSRLPIFGFYTYGEFSPLRQGEPCHFHNGSITVLALGEE